MAFFLILPDDGNSSKNKLPKQACIVEGDRINTDWVDCITIRNPPSFPEKTLWLSGQHKVLELDGWAGSVGVLSDEECSKLISRTKCKI
ncbi:MAG: hypothetical protein A3B96_00190 [Candidatus Spechtbacteria bacterium RIFCSPHIGHO2_02_FULL_43_15b]|nr:MAG: hypothetical protein A3B96_00190 [Candidatus Spechtbacteria bacterium RIFCSPHIGHO2_02_FULL_43_15b]